MPEKKTTRKKRERFQDLPGRPGAMVFEGTVKRPDMIIDYGELSSDKEGNEFSILASPLEEFVGQRVRVVITPLDATT